LFDDEIVLVAQVDDQIVQALLERILALTKMCWVVTKKLLSLDQWPLSIG
jgi:hypothetical protein